MTGKNLEINEQYWDAFYKTNHRHTPSQFCVCVLTEISPDAVVVEFGSGNGRDSHYFASQGHITVAIDLSTQAIKACEDLASSREIIHSRFVRGDLTDLNTVQRLVELARELADGKEVVYYSRFVMHTLDDEQESQFLYGLSASVQAGELVYLEFRSKEDEALEKHYGNHYRRFINAEKFRDGLKADFDFDVQYFIVGRGMAKFREEDPYVCRVIARKE